MVKRKKKSQNIKIFNFRIQVFVTLILLKLVQTFLKVEAQITSDKLYGSTHEKKI